MTSQHKQTVDNFLDSNDDSTIIDAPENCHLKIAAYANNTSKVRCGRMILHRSQGAQVELYKTDVIISDVTYES